MKKIIYRKEKVIDFKYRYENYCQYTHERWDLSPKSSGQSICPLRYKDYDDGYSTHYICMIDKKSANEKDECRIENNALNFQDEIIVKELYIEYGDDLYER